MDLTEFFVDGRGGVLSAASVFDVEHFRVSNYEPALDLLDDFEGDH